MKDILLKQFSGPLDLLLSLVQEKKLEINEIALSDVTEQFLAYIEGLEKKSPDELADFLGIAARLLLLKSRSLLPQFFPDEIDEQSLEEQLRLYQRFVEVSKKIHQRWDLDATSFFRIEPTKKTEIFIAPSNFSEETLHVSIKNLLIRLAPKKPLPQTTIDATISLKQRILDIHAILKKNKSVSFASLLANGSTKTDIIVNFLAILELVKQRSVLLKQHAAFDNIEMRKM